MQHKLKKRRITPKRVILFIVLAVLLAGRAALPSLLLRFVNGTLADMPGYHGHVDEIDVALFRGAYRIEGLRIDKLDSAGKSTRLLTVPAVDLSVQWSALFHGAIVGELVFDRPRLAFTHERVELGQVVRDTAKFRKVLDAVMPLRINRLEVNEGSLHYVDLESTPPIDIALQHMHVLARNLKSVADRGDTLPASLEASARSYEGRFACTMRLDPLAASPAFDMDLSLEETNLALLNDFFRAYGRFDIHRGTMSLYSELAARDGAFSGYVKPVIRELDVVGPEDQGDGFLQRIWETIVGAAGVLFRNRAHDQLATRITLRGDLEHPRVSTVETLWAAFLNAFVEAIVPRIDNAVSFGLLADNQDRGDRR